MNTTQQPAPEAREELLNRIAKRVAAYRIEAPAVLFLEMHKPLAGLAFHGIHFAAPLLAPFFGLATMEELGSLLGSPQGVERLIQKIEEAAQARGGPRQQDGTR